MNQSQFNDLSKRYLEGKTTEEEDKYLLEWLNKQPQPVIPNFDESQKNATKNRIWRNLEAHTNTEVSINQPWFKTKIFKVLGSGIAACLLLGLFLLVKDMNSQQQQLAQNNQKIPLEDKTIELKNITASEQEITLEDGTIVLLKQNSSILYGKDFNKVKREITLKGEAFFKVKRDVTKPFVIHTGALITEVLGTSFRIKQSAKTNIVEVVVRTGKVSIYSEKLNENNERAGLVLTPNQKAIFDENTQNIIPSLVEAPLPILAEEGVQDELVFQETPLKTVLDRLTAIYGVEFVIQNSTMQACSITADLTNLSMFTQLDLICKSIDASYEKRGTVIFISGTGCN